MKKPLERLAYVVAWGVFLSPFLILLWRGVF